MADNDPVQRFIHQVDYNPEEIQRFTRGGHRLRFLRNRSKYPTAAVIEAAIVHSGSCRSGYATGERFIIDLNGGLVVEHCPRRLCIHLISQFALPVSLICERISEGLNPQDFHFARQVRCDNLSADCMPNGGVFARLRIVR